MLTGKALKYFFFSRRPPFRDREDPFFRSLAAVLSDDMPCPGQEIMRRVRREYLSDRGMITLRDVGAGHRGRKRPEPRRSIRNIARHSSGHLRYHRLLCRMSRHFEPSVILETGTALGMGTLALALGNPAARIITIEGDPALAARARDLFEKEKITRITLLEGLFDERLPEVTAREEKIGLVFLDGHHEEQATLRYFGMLLPSLHEKSIVVADDIHWSQGMLRAWESLRHHERVSLSVDLFRMGILFFDPALKKETLVVRY